MVKKSVRIAPTAASCEEALGSSRRARREPTQQRSKDRLGRILEAARQIIADQGSEHLKMSEVALIAEISIGSLYQYFSDKGALIRALAERHGAESRRCIREALVAADNLEGLQTAYEGLIDRYYAVLLAEPVMRDIWYGMQADKNLMALELEESRACGVLLSAAIRRVRRRANSQEVESAAFLIWQLGEATMRLAVTTDRKEGDALVATYKRMTWREIDELVGRR